jgi:hypothetical protein
MKVKATKSCTPEKTAAFQHPASAIPFINGRFPLNYTPVKHWRNAVNLRHIPQSWDALISNEARLAGPVDIPKSGSPI